MLGLVIGCHQIERLVEFVGGRTLARGELGLALFIIGFPVCRFLFEILLRALELGLVALEFTFPLLVVALVDPAGPINNEQVASQCKRSMRVPG